MTSSSQVICPKSIQHPLLWAVYFLRTLKKPLMYAENNLGKQLDNNLCYEFFIEDCELLDKDYVLFICWSPEIFHYMSGT